MQKTMKAALALGVLALVVMGAIKQNSYYTSERISLDQIAPPQYHRDAVGTLASGDTLIFNPGFVTTGYTVEVYSAACSLAVSQDPAIINWIATRGWAEDNPLFVKAPAADMLDIAGHPYDGISLQDTTFATPIPAGATVSYSGRVSQIKLLATGVCSYHIRAETNVVY